MFARLETCLIILSNFDFCNYLKVPSVNKGVGIPLSTEDNHMTERSANMGSEKGIVSGNTTMLILQLLSEKEMYGYEMIETLRQRSNQIFELKAGTLYPLLHGLESQGFLDSYEKEFQGKMRKYYQITREGKTYLKKRVEEWNAYSEAVSNVLGGGVYGMA